MSFAEKLALTGGRPSGFDYMRLLLALSVLWMHTVRISYGDDTFLWDTPLRPFLKLILPMFFVLSGFLVAGSLERSATLVSFLGNRFIRIYPALAVEVMLSAFILGPLYTSLPLGNYFTDKLFFQYLLNVTGEIHFYLPGVFSQNPNAGWVNAQLWTVPYELICYFVFSVLFIVGVGKRRIVAPLAALLIAVAGCATRYHRLGDDWSAFTTVVPGTALVVSFFAGVTVYLYRDVIAFSWIGFWAAVAAFLAAFTFTGFGDFIAIPAMAYMTIFLGLLSPAKIGIIRGADYSYGIYLYGWPIQQAFAGLGSWTHNWILSGIVCTVLAAAFAAISWHWIEKPALGVKPQIMRLERWVLRQKKLFRFGRKIEGAEASLTSIK